MAPTDHDAEITELIWAEISKQLARRCESGASDADQARLQQVLADFSLDGLENLIAKCTRTLRNAGPAPTTLVPNRPHPVREYVKRVNLHSDDLLDEV